MTKQSHVRYTMSKGSWKWQWILKIYPGSNGCDLSTAAQESCGQLTYTVYVEPHHVYKLRCEPAPPLTSCHIRVVAATPLSHECERQCVACSGRVAHPVVHVDGGGVTGDDACLIAACTASKEHLSEYVSTAATADHNHHMTKDILGSTCGAACRMSASCRQSQATHRPGAGNRFWLRKHRECLLLRQLVIPCTHHAVLLAPVPCAHALNTSRATKNG